MACRGEGWGSVGDGRRSSCTSDTVRDPSCIFLFNMWVLYTLSSIICVQRLEAFGSLFIPKVRVSNIIHLTSDSVQAHEQVREITFGLVLCSPMLPRMGCGERSPRFTLCPSWRVLLACGLTPAGTGCSTATLEGFSTGHLALYTSCKCMASQTGPFTTMLYTIILNTFHRQLHFCKVLVDFQEAMLNSDSHALSYEWSHCSHMSDCCVDIFPILEFSDPSHCIQAIFFQIKVAWWQDSILGTLASEASCSTDWATQAPQLTILHSTLLIELPNTLGIMQVIVFKLFLFR